MKLIFIFLFFLTLNINGQTLHHQMLSSQGKSIFLSSGLKISQTIGQQSSTGNYNSSQNIIIQGFQQSYWPKYIDSNTTSNISTLTYPNPFISSINFKFSNPIIEVIKIIIFDIQGRQIFQTYNNAIDNLLTIDLPQFAPNVYLVKLETFNFRYYSQIIKQ